jgi:hypothetical protein
MYVLLQLVKLQALHGVYTYPLYSLSGLGSMVLLLALVDPPTLRVWAR